MSVVYLWIDYLQFRCLDSYGTCLHAACNGCTLCVTEYNGRCECIVGRLVAQVQAEGEQFACVAVEGILAKTLALLVLRIVGVRCCVW